MNRFTSALLATSVIAFAQDTNLFHKIQKDCDDVCGDPVEDRYPANICCTDPNGLYVEWPITEYVQVTAYGDYAFNLDTTSAFEISVHSVQPEEEMLQFDVGLQPATEGDDVNFIAFGNGEDGFWVNPPALVGDDLSNAQSLVNGALNEDAYVGQLGEGQKTYQIVYNPNKHTVSVIATSPNALLEREYDLLSDDLTGNFVFDILEDSPSKSFIKEITMKKIDVHTLKTYFSHLETDDHEEAAQVLTENVKMETLAEYI